MNKKLIRLTEQDLHRIVKESVNRILRETEGNRLPPPYDEYNEFDRGMFGDEEDEYYEYAQRFYNGDYSKAVISKLIHGCYEGEDEALGAYEYAKKNGICPEFIKRVENDISWVQIDRDVWNAENERNRSIKNAYQDSDFIRDDYDDAEDETTNRFNVLKNPFVRNGSRKAYLGKDNINSVPKGKSWVYLHKVIKMTETHKMQEDLMAQDVLFLKGTRAISNGCSFLMHSSYAYTNGSTRYEQMSYTQCKPHLTVTIRCYSQSA